MYASSTTAKARKRGARLVWSDVDCRVDKGTEAVGSAKEDSIAAGEGSGLSVEEVLMRFEGDVVVEEPRERFLTTRLAAVSTTFAVLDSGVELRIGSRVVREVLDIVSALGWSVSWLIDSFAITKEKVNNLLSSASNIPAPEYYIFEHTNCEG